MSKPDINQASEDIKIGQEVWSVISRYPTARIWTEDNHLSLDLSEGQVQVRKVVVGAIQRVETTKKSAEYFFNAKTKYHYSDDTDGVCTDQSYFTVNRGKLTGSNGYGRFYLTEEEAAQSARDARKSQNVFIVGEISNMRENLHDVLTKLEAEL